MPPQSAPPPPPQPRAQHMCNKCHQAAAQVLNGQDMKCRGCLLRTMITRLVHVARVDGALTHGDVAAVAVSGGPASSAMMHMLDVICADSWDRPQRGKVMFNMHILHINESALLPQGQGQAWQRHTDATLAAMEKYTPGCQLHRLNLEDLFPGDAEQRRQRLCATVSQLEDSTQREHFTAALRMDLLRRHADRLGCNKLLLGTSASRLVASFLGDIAKGQGYGAPSSLHLADAREGPAHCTVVRPVRTFSRKELAMYAYFENVPFHVPPAPLAPRASQQSLESLTEAFCLKLQEANPGAPSVLMKTATKLRSFNFSDVALAPEPPRASDVPHSAQPRPKKPGAQIHARCRDSIGKLHAACDTLCPVCRAPLHRQDIASQLGWGNANNTTSTSTYSSDAQSGDLQSTCSSENPVACSVCRRVWASLGVAAGPVVGSSGCAGDAEVQLPSCMQRRMRQLRGAVGVADACSVHDAGEPAGVEQRMSVLRDSIADNLLLSDSDDEEG